MANPANFIGPPAPLSDPSSIEQFGRKCSLILYQSKPSAGQPAGTLQGIDLSQLRIKFTVKKSDVQTPNVADIRVYNLATETALSILTNLAPDYNASNPIRGRVILQAGYEGNYGVLFQGNIKQVILGRESATDTFVEILCGDGDRAYNFAVVNQTLAAGSLPMDQVNAAVAQTLPHGVGLGYTGSFNPAKLPRGKSMYGNARNYLRSVAQNNGQAWSIQDEKINFVPVHSYLPGTRVVLTSKTGLIETPNQTNEGANIKCLLNPQIKVGGLIDISEASVADFKLDFSSLTSPVNFPAPVSADGVYYAMVVQYDGDTRGEPWYTTIIGIVNNPSSNPSNSVQAGYG